MNSYATKSLLQLFEGYQFENGRGNKEDAKITKALIKKELKDRLNKAISLLDECSNPDEVIKIYKQFENF